MKLKVHLIIFAQLVYSIFAKAEYFQFNHNRNTFVIWMDLVELNRSTSIIRETGKQDIFFPYAFITTKETGEITPLKLDEQKEAKFSFKLESKDLKPFSNLEFEVGTKKIILKNEQVNLKTKQNKVKNTKVTDQGEVIVFAISIEDLLKKLPLENKIYKSKNCDFEYVNQAKLNDKIFFKRLIYMNQKILNSYAGLGCELNENDEIDTQKVQQNINNKLNCQTQAFIFKNRFLATNIKCKSTQQTNNTIERKSTEKNFYEIYDIELKSTVKKEDFTKADLNDEDDSQMIEFGLSPLGIFLYYAEPKVDKVSYQRYLSYFNLKSNFEKLGSSKKYLRFFELQ